MKVPFVDAEGRYHCRKCNNYQPKDAFYDSSISHVIHMCRNCSRVDHAMRARARRQNDPFSRPLAYARRKAKEAGIPFRLDSKDAATLLQDVWSNRKGMSGIYASHEGLVLMYWDPEKDVTPFNCMPVNYAEARFHASKIKKTSDLTTNYSARIRKRVIKRLKISKRLTKISMQLVMDAEPVRTITAADAADDEEEEEDFDPEDDE